MTKLYYQDEESLQAIDQLLNVVDKSLKKEDVILIGGDSSSYAVGNFIGGTLGNSLIRGGVSGTFNNEYYIPNIHIKLILWHKIKGFFKNLFTSKYKRENELLKKKVMRLTKVVEKQNTLLEKYKKQCSKLEQAYENSLKGIDILKSKVREYEVLLDALSKAYKELQSDIEQMAG